MLGGGRLHESSGVSQQRVRGGFEKFEGYYPVRIVKESEEGIGSSLNFNRLTNMKGQNKIDETFIDALKSFNRTVNSST